MRIPVLLLALALTPLPVFAQSVTLDVCDTGTADIDVLVSSSGAVSSSHIKPSTCTTVTKSRGGGMQPAYLGIAFADARGQWGGARRFDRIPSMGEPKTLTAANSNATVPHGNANVSVPLSLLFQPPLPECRSVGTGNSFTTRTGRTETTTVEKTTICEDVVYTLTVEPYPDSREASLGRLDTGGFFSDGPLGTTVVRENSEVDWAEVAAERKQRDAAQAVGLNDVLAALKRVESGERLSSGERFALPPYILVRGTVSRVEIRQHPVDATTNIPVAEINFRESPAAVGRTYPEFNVCTERLDVLQEVFGADFRTSMIGKTIEAQGKPEGLCWGQLGEIQIYLARQIRPVQSAQFAAGTRVWVPPPLYVPPALPPPSRAEVDAEVAAGAKTAAYYVQTQAVSRMRKVCIDISAKPAANQREQDAINKETAACFAPIVPAAQKESEKAETCARELLKDNPQRMGRDAERFYKELDTCIQSR